jgi:hypothetical protein
MVISLYARSQARSAETDIATKCYGLLTNRLDFETARFPFDSIVFGVGGYYHEDSVNNKHGCQTCSVFQSSPTKANLDVVRRDYISGGVGGLKKGTDLGADSVTG